MTCFLSILTIQAFFIVCVDGGWSGWKKPALGPCPLKCRITYILTRTCLNPAPAYGGSLCSGPNTLERTDDCTGDSCVDVNGGWSAWNIYQLTPCAINCKKKVQLMRGCTRPFPRGVGRPCSGSSSKIAYVDCTGHNCAIGQWSAWVRESSSVCSAGCTQTVNYGRTCTYPRNPTIAAKCNGRSTLQITEHCKTDTCLRVNGGWSPWSSYSNGECLQTCTQEVLSRRTCTNPTPVGAGEYCNGKATKRVYVGCSWGKCNSETGQWSVWSATITSCLKNCTRKVLLTRMCVNSGSSPRCHGSNTNIIYKKCTGDSCVRREHNTEHGQWSDWNTDDIGVCQSTCKRNISLSRRCTHSAPPGRRYGCIGHATRTILEDCKGGNCKIDNAHWSSWVIDDDGPCQPSCKKYVTAKRRCIGEGLQCNGSGERRTLEDCACAVASSTYSASIVLAAVAIPIGIIILCIAAVLFLFRRKHLKEKKRKSTKRRTHEVRKHRHHYNNPVFII